MAQGEGLGVGRECGGGGEVEEVAEEDVGEDVEVVCVEIFVSRRGGEEKVKNFEDEELEGCFAWYVEGQ